MDRNVKICNSKLSCIFVHKFGCVFLWILFKWVTFDWVFLCFSACWYVFVHGWLLLSSAGVCFVFVLFFNTQTSTGFCEHFDRGHLILSESLKLQQIPRTKVSCPPLFLGLAISRLSRQPNTLQTLAQMVKLPPQMEVYKFWSKKKAQLWAPVPIPN